MGALTAMVIDILGYDPHDADAGTIELEQLDRHAMSVGSVLRARQGARDVAVARLGSGRLVVVDDVCPHDGGRISDGYVEGERLVCARHGWELEVDLGDETRCHRVRRCKLRE